MKKKDVKQLNLKMNSIMKKGLELSTLCGVDVCIVSFGEDGKVETWPENSNQLKLILNRYKEEKSRIQIKNNNNMAMAVHDHGESSKAAAAHVQPSPTRIRGLLDGLSTKSLQTFSNQIEARLKLITDRINILSKTNNDPSHSHSQSIKHSEHYSAINYGGEDCFSIQQESPNFEDFSTIKSGDDFFRDLLSNEQSILPSNQMLDFENDFNSGFITKQGFVTDCELPALWDHNEVLEYDPLQKNWDPSTSMENEGVLKSKTTSSTNRSGEMFPDFRATDFTTPDVYPPLAEFQEEVPFNYMKDLLDSQSWYDIMSATPPLPPQFLPSRYDHAQ
ncbi:agamous-like MADS-box protein AGL75 [Impatiens glandulifera]|uniref:agamous-like MADS-box protein AGL75 n=1 Tax=Impatiens glandulifera TaxID=253017 RepID=UPI001FB18DEC|nr:agamous-like MADS-box protein AGL75 [Impatiens glandulifera]